MKTFTKTVEDFSCTHCGAVVHGNGYTNHCPHCLWSCHVDNNPGDRASTCHGMMEPVSVESAGARFVITHRCTVCGHTRRQHTSDDDSMDAIIELSKNTAFIYGK